MSMAPHWLMGTRSGWGLGPSHVVDSLWDALTDRYIGIGMSETAENIAARCSITRERQDALALESHRRALAAIASGAMAEEITAVPTKRGDVTRDEHPRETSLQQLANLKPRFREGGTVTAGNASGINDGAAAVVIADCVPDGARPLGRIVSWGISGVDPNVMGLGPIAASRMALKRAGLKMADMRLVELNEAFAAQVVAVQQELGMDPQRTNLQGGAIALGHPVGASGTRLLLTLLMQLQRLGGGYGLATLCIGGGQGIAMVVEALA